MGWVRAWHTLWTERGGCNSRAIIQTYIYILLDMRLIIDAGIKINPC